MPNGLATVVRSLVIAWGITLGKGTPNRLAPIAPTPLHRACSKFVQRLKKLYCYDQRMMSFEQRRKSLVAFFFGTTAAIHAPESSVVIASASRRAYRDLSRTLHGMRGHPDAESLKVDTDESIIEFLNDLTEINNAIQFNELHELWCAKAINRFDESPHPDREMSLSYGQAQKWLNMTLKYLAVLGHETVNSVYEYLHVPVDKIIYQQAENLGVPAPKRTAWSRLGRDQYIEYQKALREKIKTTYGDDYVSLDWETDKWIDRPTAEE